MFPFKVASYESLATLKLIIVTALVSSSGCEGQGSLLSLSPSSLQAKIKLNPKNIYSSFLIVFSFLQSFVLRFLFHLKY